jgi:hypothetical protein
MPLKLLYITNEENIAKIAEESGITGILIDLEINGKEKRQGHLDTVISRHNIDDVKKIRRRLTETELFVRVNPVYDGTKAEVNRVINDGADVIMLPFFKTKAEVQEFIRCVNGRAKTCLLCETAEAVENIDDILSLVGVDLFYIGLNDLHLAYKMNFMFELLANGTVETLCNKFKTKGTPYGFGGIAKLGQGKLPAEHVIAEHYRLGSSIAILSRSFCNANNTDDFSEFERGFKKGVNEIRTYEVSLMEKDSGFFAYNHVVVKNKVMQIKTNMVEQMNNSRMIG